MILMNDFKKEPQKLIDAQMLATERVLKSGWYVLGPAVEKFESDWKTYLTGKFVSGVANGMDAIEIGIRAMNFPAGSEIITTPMTAFATVLAIYRAGLQPVLADIDPMTGVLQTESVLNCIGPKTKAILLVHLYGRATNMDQWINLARSNNISLLEDCAQAHGAKWSGKSLGTFGVFGAWSFYPTKNLGAIGDGGAISTNSLELNEKIRVIRNYGQSERYHHPVAGMNSRLDELQAAILTERLKWLDEYTEMRRQIAETYWQGIRNNNVELLLPPEARENHVHHLFVLKTKKRAALMQHLKDRQISSLIHYPIPVHQQKPCSEIRKSPSGLANCEKYATECMSIPIHPQLTTDEVKIVIDAINEFK